MLFLEGRSLDWLGGSGTVLFVHLDMSFTSWCTKQTNSLGCLLKKLHNIVAETEIKAEDYCVNPTKNEDLSVKVLVFIKIVNEPMSHQVDCREKASRKKKEPNKALNVGFF